MTSATRGAGGAPEKSHREILRAMTTEQKLWLTRRSDTAGLTRLAWHLGVIAAFVWLGASVDGWIRVVAMVGQGVAMVFLFTAMHECSHGTAFRSRWMNRLVAAGAGCVLFMGPVWFFQFHQDHHRHTQDLERDPELLSARPSSTSEYLWHLSGLPSWAGSLRVLFGNALAMRRDAYVSSAARASVVWEARAILVVHAIALPVLFWQGWLVWHFVLPLLAGQPFLRAFLLAEHAGCEQTSGNMLRNTRTLLTTPPVRFLTWNMSYHTEHHCFPAVPFYRLGDLHTIMRAELVNTSPGYVAFHRRFLNALRSGTRGG